MDKTSQWYLKPLKLAPLAVIALLIPTTVVGHDSWLHLIWLEQFSSLVKDGVLYPRWLPLSNGGFGSPTFYFYPPLAAYLGSVAALVSANAREIDLFRFVAYVGTIGSILSFRYYLNRLRIPASLAWAGALVYAMMPYRALDLVLRNALGEHLAFVWIPIVFSGIELLREEGRSAQLKGLMISAVGFALLLLTNIPSSIAVAIALPIYAWLRHENGMRIALMSIASLVMGSLLVSFYVLPAISLRDLIQPSHLWDAGTSRTGSSFTLIDLFAKDSNSFTNANAVTLLGGVLALVLAVALWRKRDAPVAVVTKAKGIPPEATSPQSERRLAIAWGAVVALALAMQIPTVSTFIYQLPVVSYLQFSWRWNLLLVPGIVTIFVLLYRTRPLPVLMMTAVFAITTVMLVTGFNAKYKRHQSTDVLKIEYSDAFEYIPATALHSTHAIADFVAKHRTDPPVLLNRLGTATLTEQHGDTREYTFDLPQPTTATFHLFHWPLWKLEVDGKRVATSPDGVGRLTAELPAGKYLAALTLEADTSQTVGGWVTLAAMLILIGMVGVSRRNV